MFIKYGDSWRKKLLTVVFKPMTNDAQKTFQKSKTFLSVYSLFPSNTDKKAEKFSLFWNGSGVKSYVRKCFILSEEMRESLVTQIWVGRSSYMTWIDLFSPVFKPVSSYILLNFFEPYYLLLFLEIKYCHQKKTSKTWKVQKFLLQGDAISYGCVTEVFVLFQQLWQAIDNYFAKSFSFNTQYSIIQCCLNELKREDLEKYHKSVTVNSSRIFLF